MSKIIYRKIRTAPGVKQYLDDNSAYFAQAVTLETLSLRDMAKHITSHGSPFTADVVIGVLEAFRSCLIEQLLESKKVKVQGLGTFYVTIANKEGGIKNLADFNINTLATGLRLRFLPEGATEESISSKDFLKKAKFVDVATLTKDKTVSDEETDDDDVTGGDDNGGGNQEDNLEAIMASSSKEGHIHTWFVVTSNMLDGTYTGLTQSNVRFDYYSGTVSVRHVMVEKATKPSGWSPAPEDVQAEKTGTLCDMQA